jgi:hypothetical protein
VPTSRERSQPLDDRAVVGLTIALTVGTWMARPVPPALLLIVAATVLGALIPGGSRHRRIAALVLLTIVLGSWSGDRAWRTARSGPTVLVDVDVIGTLITDPAPVGSGRSVVIEIDGRRYEALAFGSPSRRLAPLLAGSRFTSRVGSGRPHQIGRGDSPLATSSGG